MIGQNRIQTAALDADVVTTEGPTGV